MILRIHSGVLPAATFIDGTSVHRRATHSPFRDTENKETPSVLHPSKSIPQQNGSALKKLQRER